MKQSYTVQETLFILKQMGISVSKTALFSKINAGYIQCNTKNKKLLLIGVDELYVLCYLFTLTKHGVFFRSKDEYNRSLDVFRKHLSDIKQAKRVYIFHRQNDVFAATEWDIRLLKGDVTMFVFFGEPFALSIQKSMQTIN